MVNNTFVAGEGWAIKITSNAGSHIFFNNILLAEGTLGGSICVDSGDFVARSNACVDRFAMEVNEGECSVVSLADWKKAGQGIGSFVTSADELFVAPRSDFRLKTDAPARNGGAMSVRGIRLPSYDIAGAPRIQGAGPDIGAFEHY